MIKKPHKGPQHPSDWLISSVMNAKTGPKASPFHSWIIWNWWTGRAIRDDKTGAISDALPPVLTRLGIEQQVWLDMINHYEQQFFRAVGTMVAHQLDQCWIKGQSAGKSVYKQPLPT